MTGTLPVERMFNDVLAVKAALLHGFAQQRILVVGDLMLDRYLWGTASRISPEAPVPVVKVERRTLALGGAANVARNLRSLGIDTLLAGFVGDDEGGRAFRAECEAHGIGCAAVVARGSTVVKTRVLADDRQVLRFDDEDATPRSSDEAELLLQAIARALDEAPPAAAILSDYAKGLATPTFCARLISMCFDRGIPIYVDPKGRDYDKYRGATAIKPNRIEMAELSSTLGWVGTPVENAAKLRDRLGLSFVALTLGAQGIAVVRNDGVHELPTVAREVFDVSGAGDTVIATLVAGLASGLVLEDAANLANVAAAEVIAHIGTVPVGRDALLVAVQEQDRVHAGRKLYTLEELQVVVNAWKARGLKVALTNGCFDLLHAGHVRVLEDSAAQADRLIVALNSDASITRLKGPSRPLMTSEGRTTVLSGLECVDAVVLFEEDTPLNVIETVRPDVLVKGGDYTEETVVGSNVVRSYGGEVRLVPLVPGLSTTRLVEGLAKL